MSPAALFMLASFAAPPVSDRAAEPDGYQRGSIRPISMPYTSELIEKHRERDMQQDSRIEARKKLDSRFNAIYDMPAGRERDSAMEQWRTDFKKHREKYERE